MLKKPALMLLLALAALWAFGGIISATTTPAPAPLNTNAATDSGGDSRPQVTTDTTGHWVAVWVSSDSLGGTIGTDRDILVARSADNGSSWTTPAPLSTSADTDSRDDFWPQVTTDGAGNWVAAWMSFDSLGGTIGTDSDILMARSTDNGATWTDPAPLNTNAPTDSGGDNIPQVTTDGAGNWLAVWGSTESLGGTIGTDTDILVSRSTDSGATWTAPAALNTDAATDWEFDQSPQATTDGEGNWVAVWESRDTGPWLDFDLLVSRSTDDGVTWTDPIPLNPNAATDLGNDQFPQMTTDGAGNWVAVWYGDNGVTLDIDILVSRSTDSGVTWTIPAELNTNAASETGFNFDPQVTTDGAGNWVAVWTSADSLGGTIGTDSDILVSRSTDNGITWTDPAPLNTNAPSDLGGDFAPQVTTDGAGNWLAVWGSTESLGGTIGTDSDILYTTCLPIGVKGGCIGVDPAGLCVDEWPTVTIAVIGKGQSPANNLKLSHEITGNIVGGAAAYGPTAQRIQICEDTAVTAVVSDTTGTPTNTVLSGPITCTASGCAVSALTTTAKYKSVSSDRRDTDRLTLVPVP